ncbi:MAG: pirin-like C-terminal cupin domain-containing protein [Eisenbergiella massiliensis]
MLFTLTGKIMIGETVVEEKTAAKLSSGTSVSIKSLQEPAQVLFMSSEALNEPVAWGGPVVMNTREELQEAWKELENDTFVRRT